MKYKTKPVEIEATQWFKNGDHPDDRVGEQIPDPAYAPEDGKTYTAIEGRVVRFFRNPDVSGTSKCEKCGEPMHEHGWIDETENGRTACPGDFVITNELGAHIPMDPNTFNDRFEPVLSPKDALNAEFEARHGQGG